jgi:hypothetical protein
MKTISDLDKQSLRNYVKLINEDQGKVKIKISFNISSVDDCEYLMFNVNGKNIIRFTLDEAISFLDGLMTALDACFLDQIS